MDAAIAGLQRLAGEALVVLLQLAAALAGAREGDVPGAVRTLSQVVEASPSGPYAEEALYWRARIAEVQPDLQARVSAANDYRELARRLPRGRRRSEALVRLAALTEPGRVLEADEAREASRRQLLRIGRALHDYAADHGGALPGALEDLLDDYVTDPAVLVRPGRRQDGGGLPYSYRPGVRADLRSALGQAGDRGVPAVVGEPAYVAGGERLVLGLDGAVRSVQDINRSPSEASAGDPGR
jgi:hypothetical protein